MKKTKLSLCLGLVISMQLFLPVAQANPLSPLEKKNKRLYCSTSNRATFLIEDHSQY